MSLHAKIICRAPQLLNIQMTQYRLVSKASQAETLVNIPRASKPVIQKALKAKPSFASLNRILRSQWQWQHPTRDNLNLVYSTAKFHNLAEYTVRELPWSASKKKIDVNLIASLSFSHVSENLAKAGPGKEKPIFIYGMNVNPVQVADAEARDMEAKNSLKERE